MIAPLKSKDLLPGYWRPLLVILILTALGSALPYVFAWVRP